MIPDKCRRSGCSNQATRGQAYCSRECSPLGRYGLSHMDLSRSNLNKRQPGSLDDRIFSRIEKRDGHWIWMGNFCNGVARSSQRSNVVHVAKYLFEKFKHAAPQTRRQCHEPRCVNPAHRLANTEVFYS